MTALEQFLSRAYAAQHGLSKEPLATVVSAFADAAALDPKLISAAQLRLVALTDAICDRDHISSQHRSFLQTVLSSS